MKTKIYIIAIILFSVQLRAESIKFIPFDSKLELCSNQELILKWTGSADDYIVQAKSELFPDYRLVKFYKIENNNLSWLINDKDLLNSPLTIRISDKNNPTNFSEISNIVIYQKTEILQQTNSAIVCEGENVYLNVEALGYGLSYNWYKDGEMLKNEHSGILTITNTNFSNSGLYQCRIKSASGCEDIFSQPISVYATSKTKFASRPDNIEWQYMDSIRIFANLHTNFDNENDFVKFRWFKDTVLTIILSVNPIQYRFDTIMLQLFDNHKISGTNSQCLQIKDIVWDDRGTYRCFADGMCGSDSTSCILGESGMFKIIKNSPDFTSCEGKDITFKVRVETDVPGAVFTYQWYKSGYKIVKESDKFIGTTTPELTIKNVKAIVDEQAYYVLVKMLNLNLSRRSPSFVCVPKYKPTIVYQSKFWVIKGRRTDYQNVAYLKVNVSNFESCYYEWYKDGKVVFSGMDQDYRGGSDSAKNVGWFVCKLTNQCGVTWSDSMYIAYGYSDVSACKRSNLYLNADNLGSGYTYKWFRDGKEITESDKYQNVKSNQMVINDVFESDEGDYLVYAVDNINKNEIFLGSIYAEVNFQPYLVRDFPDKLSNEEDFMRMVSVTAVSKGPGIQYTLFLDGQEIQKGYRNRNVFHYTDFGFVLGGRNSNLKPGVYQYYFKSDCGEAWSNKLTVINSNYRPGGIIIAGEDEEFPSDVIIMNDNEFKVYPNPASDFITISIPENYNHTLQGVVENGREKVQIFNTLGIEVSSAGGGRSEVDGGGYRIDISHLPVGVYFIKIGDKVGKFVKM